jgi:hypothetical protein
LYSRHFYKFKALCVTLYALSLCPHLSAQTESSNLEFIENKGQWDARALLKADIGNGSLFFHKNGIRVVLHDEREMAVLV